jgi:hypothetical protein
MVAWITMAVLIALIRLLDLALMSSPDGGPPGYHCAVGNETMGHDRGSPDSEINREERMLQTQREREKREKVGRETRGESE